jgi:acetylornithine deacetylase/succinyl-diaminopimelate desuccinylase-like protein
MTSVLGPDGAAAVSAYVDAHADDLIEKLSAWLRIPSVSSDAERTDDVRASADWLHAVLRETGFPVVETWETPGHPAIFASWPSNDPDAPTVLVYGHHDVQPTGDGTLWEAEPFEPTVVGDELKARGSADDKGQIMFHLTGLGALFDATGLTAPPVHLLMLVEGEEEMGSPNFRALLEEHRAELACDVVVVSDTGVYGRDVISTCTGMRGLVYAHVDVTGPTSELHSGLFGGAVPNPAAVLASLVAGLHDADGRVTLDGFYDRVVPIGDEERTLLAALPYDESVFLEQASSTATGGEAGYTTLERIGARPTAEVNGLWGGFIGDGQKTVVPTDAHAKISFRLVADQDPAEVEDAFRSYVEAAAPPGITAAVSFSGNVRPCLTPLGDPALGAVRAALAAGFGLGSADDVLITREGGSGPEADLADVLEAPVVFLGVGLPDDRIHAPNERVVIPMLLAGARAAAHLWPLLATALRPS